MNTNFKFLALFPPLFLARDFLPDWYILVIGLYLMLLSLSKLPKFIGYLLPILIYFVFQSVGVQIIPETTIPCLAILILAQLTIDRAKGRFSNYLGFLWFGIFSLFSVNLYFIIYSIVIFIFFFVSEYKAVGDDYKNSLKTIFKYKKQLLITIITSCLLFIFFPRFNSFLPSANNRVQGKVGYSQTINNTMTSDLALSSNTAFYAELSKTLPPESLYWRGRVHNFTDGYNWRHTQSPTRRSPSVLSNIQRLTTQIKYEQDFGKDIIILDTPIKIVESNSRIHTINSTNEKKLYTSKKKVIFTSQSSLDNPFQKTQLSNSEKVFYLQLPSFTPKVLQSINKMFEGAAGTNEIIDRFSSYIIEAKFGYSLSPGSMPSMAIFLEKKIGYCTHFASFLGIILRMNGVPARLVSGFQGGTLNKIGKYYEIKSNDAHAWVEYFDDGQWNRVDPTAFISPERIQFGGDRFLTTSPAERESNVGARFPFFYQLKQYVDNLDYKVSLFFDNYNKDKQKSLSNLLKLSLKQFLIIGALMIISLLILFYILYGKKIKTKPHPMDKYLDALDKKLKHKKIKLSKQLTIKDMIELIKHNEPSLLVLKEYEKLRYSKYSDEKRIKELLRDLF